jgi:anti-sigma B factor antagonist
MNFELTNKEGITFIKVISDKATSEIKTEFEECLFTLIEKDKLKKIALDLTNVSFVDSSFLGSLVKGLKKTSSKMGDIKVFGLKQPVRAMFELTRLYKVFEIFDDETDLIKSY